MCAMVGSPPAPDSRRIAISPGKLRVTIGTISRAYAEAERRGLIVGEGRSRHLCAASYWRRCDHAG